MQEELMHLGNGKKEIKVTEQNSKVFNTSITSLAFKILKTCPGYLASLRKKKKSSSAGLMQDMHLVLEEVTHSILPTVRCNHEKIISL